MSAVGEIGTGAVGGEWAATHGEYSGEYSGREHLSPPIPPRSGQGEESEGGTMEESRRAGQEEAR
jgi:hypothetical protein